MEKMKNVTKDACYMCIHVGDMNIDGNIICHLLKIEAEPWHCCPDFIKKTNNIDS